MVRSVIETRNIHVSSNNLHAFGDDLSRSDQPNELAQTTPACASREIPVDVKLMATMAQEILADMSLGACAETITQTVQVLDLGNGKKAALRITITTDDDAFM